MTKTSIPSFSTFFESVTGRGPHSWQRRLGDAVGCEDRLLRVPTGFGKTAGTVLPWAYHRTVRQDRNWPNRLAFCLPMRTLVEQTASVLKEWLAKLPTAVPVHVLMGGSTAGDWHLNPEFPAVLVGTQDMLLSRALNRGFGANRPRWPMEFGLLHSDVLWVFDEVQLMDVALATSAQLAAFRRADESHAPIRPVHSWWMSATLQPRWLETVDHEASARKLAKAVVSIPPTERTGELWDVRKSIAHEAAVETPEEIAERTLVLHATGTTTLVVVNTVDRAIRTHAALSKRSRPRKGKAEAKGPAHDGPELRLVHSRFRGSERALWPSEFLGRTHSPPKGGRIIVATQVVEAGVDMSSALLLSDLAPWSSLIQRFGRCARYSGEAGRLVVLGNPSDSKKARPYELSDLQAAAQALARLEKTHGDASPSSLAKFEERLEIEDPELFAALYAYEPEHVLRRQDLLDLFDTTPDLSGADLDVSRYIRVGDDRNVQLFWRKTAEKAIALDRAQVGVVRREELCPAPLDEVRSWRNEHDVPAWRLDYIEGVWRRLDRRDSIVPGQVLMLSTEAGGYDLQTGWTGARRASVPEVPGTSPREPFEDLAEEAEDDESASALQNPRAWQGVADHGLDVAAELRSIAQSLGPAEVPLRLLQLAARWHDLGKCHPVFQDAIRRDSAGEFVERRDVAKAPQSAWKRPPFPERRGFRHELASTLALFELLRRTDIGHPALLGEWEADLPLMGVTVEPPDEQHVISREHPLAKEIVALTRLEFDTVAWLICSHHGKVRGAWVSAPRDQKRGMDSVHGVQRGDSLPDVELATETGDLHPLPRLALHLDAAALGLNGKYGAAWSDRVSGLLSAHGPFRLAWLEALLRAGDIRASRKLEGRS